MYDLHALGWHSFQQLCHTIAREVLGQTVESFLDSADAGRDGAFAGTWHPRAGEALTGRFVIQCKFTGKRDSTLRPSMLREEREKAAQLVQAGLCDVYALMTNAGISGRSARPIQEDFSSIGVKHVVLWDYTWICRTINENKRLRMLVPRVYGLGDLSEILDERAYKQAQALLASMREGLSKVVVTGVYRRAADALNAHGFVLLVGEPAAGKTTIASLLAMGALDQWNASTLKLDHPAQVVEHWNPDAPYQFFWVDDAFGVMQYEDHLVHAWNHVFAQVTAMLRKGAKIVMTSRDYIYKRARRELKESAFPLMRESQVVVNVQDLTLEDRKQILYNHIKLGAQGKPFRSSIKPHLEAIAAHPRFVPETARRLADPLFTAQLRLTGYGLHLFVEKQESLLREVLSGLDAHSTAALALIYMRNNFLESPVTLQKSERDAVERLNSALGACVAALQTLDGSLAQYVQSDRSAIWRFKHPTIGDAFASLLLENPELLGIYLHGAPLQDLMDQVTCGDVGLEHTVVLQPAFFPIVLDRLEEELGDRRYKSQRLSAWDARHRLDNFLAHRCSREFLAHYMERHPDLLDRVSRPGLFLDAVSEVPLAVRLHEVGLLPEEERLAFVKAVTSYTVDGEDGHALRDTRIQSVFTAEELTSLRQRVRRELLPMLEEVRSNWELNHPGEQPAVEYMQPFLELLEALKEECAGDTEVVKRIDRQIGLANEWVAEHTGEDGPERESVTFADIASSEQAPDPNRSIFEDVDE